MARGRRNTWRLERRGQSPVQEPVVGRAAELAVIEQAVVRAASGAGSLLLVQGEAGVGKSRLLGEALDQGRKRGFKILLGVAEELDGRRPFGALADALGVDRHAADPARAEINKLLVGATEASLMEFRISEALLALVEELCARTPVVLGVEDLHWADLASLSTLWRLGRHVHQLPLLVVGSFRPVPTSPELGRLVESLDAGSSHLVLSPLPPLAVEELARRLLGADLGPNLARQVTGAAGNPLFVEELLGALVTEGRIRLDARGRAEVEGQPLPQSLQLTILSRLNGLPAETLHVLQVASILGPSFSLAELGLLTGRSTSDLLAVLQSALGAGMLQDAGPRLAFRHELLRDALYQNLPQAVRLGLHGDLARELAETGAPALRVAEHFLRGNGAGEREAVRWLRRAASDAGRRSPAAAAELLERALELTDASDPERDQVLVELAETLLWSGRPSETEAICRELLGRGTDRAFEAVLRQLLMSSLFNQSRNTEAREEAELAARAADISTAQRATLIASGSWARLMVGDLEGAADEAARALALAADSGSSPEATCRALQTLAASARLRGDFSEGLRHIESAVQIADRSPDRSGHRMPLHLWRGLLLMEMDRFSECQQALADGRELAEALGTTANLPNYHFAAGSACWWAGAWDDAAAEYQAGLELAEEVGAGWRLTGYGMLALTSLHRDNLSGAEQLLAAAEDHLARSGRQPQLHLVRWPAALLLEACGQVEAAFEVLAETWDVLAAAGAWGMCPRLGPDLARLALAVGDRARAGAVSASVEKLAQANESRGLRGADQLCRGLVAGAPELLAAAAESFDVCGRPFEQAGACELAGNAAVVAGEASEGRRLLETSLERYEELEATRDMARVAASLRALGLRRGRRGPRRRPKLGWEALTETERRVVQLVAEGLSNPKIAERMFLSRRTVQTHVSHILGKLNLNSRVELAATVARRRS